MKKIFVFLFITPMLIFSQYYGERTTEQSFEQSELYFNSYFLNPFGLLNFKNVAPGLIDDPFLNLSVNPAHLPEIKNGDYYIYLDFRGDRTSPVILDNYVIPANYYYDAIYYRPYYDPRWFSNTRTEPEPAVSFGLLTYPIRDITDKFFIGGTYQYIRRDEKFYTLPYGIYTSSYYYDALGVKNEGLADVPIQDRYSGRDDMVNEGHLFSAFTGYRLFDNLKLGISLNGISHTRDGGYLDSYNDEYGNTDRNEWERLYDQNRIQEYSHIDLNGGILYDITPGLNVGAKAGILDGDADQTYDSHSFYFSQYNTPNVSNDWYYYYSNSSTGQSWTQEGKTKYFSFNINSHKDNKEITAYYKYSKTDIDLTTSSSIIDTSNNSSRWIYTYNGTYTYDYWGNSSAKDIRSGTGFRDKIRHQALLAFKWELTDLNSVSVGFYIQNTDNKIHSEEPVIAVRKSEHHHTDTNPEYNYDYDYTYSIMEDKVLVWNYTADFQTIQIPVLVDFNFGEHFGLTLGINRILQKWDIEDVTTAYFAVREKNENGELKREVNFGERYTQPRKRITENTTDFITQLKIAISPSFKINVLLDPEFDNKFHFAQWWLSFNAEI